MIIKDLVTGERHEYGTNPHDSLVVSKNGRSLTYYNLQNGDGSMVGEYRFEPMDGDINYWNIGGMNCSEIPNNWIPCSERLPEDVEVGSEYPTVLFCTKDAVYAGFFEYYLGGQWWACEDYVVPDVIAWMPLPKPYEEGSEG